jgi:hypothetical protein
MRLKFLKVVFSNEKLKILNQNFTVSIEYYNNAEQRIFYIIDNPLLTVYFILNKNPEEKLKMLKKMENDINTIEKEKHKQLPDIIDELIRKEIFTNEIILYLNDIKNSLLDILNDENWNNENIKLFTFKIEGYKESLKIDDKLFTISPISKIEIDNENKKYLRENEFFFEIDKYFYIISPNYISEITDYIIDHIEDFYNNCIHIIENVKIEKQWVCNNKDFILIYNPWNIISLLFQDKSEIKLILSFGCTSKKEFKNSINLTRFLIKNKNIILNLFNKHKVSVYNYMSELIDKILFDIDVFRNKIIDFENSL